MKYYSYDIVLQEVPNEISLSFTITGCSLRCEGCHSSHLWNGNNGSELTHDIMVSIIKKYKTKISCVLFFGGEWCEEDLIEKLEIINTLGYKTCLYTGLELDDVSKKIMEKLTYLKYGKWDAIRGGLDKCDTNQVFLSVIDNQKLNVLFMNN